MSNDIQDILGAISTVDQFRGGGKKSAETDPVDNNTASVEKKEVPQKTPELISENENKDIHSPVILSVSEAAKLGGVTTKTIRRAIQSRRIKYKIVNNRYQIDFASVIDYLRTTTKLNNKLNQDGIGQYIKEWLI